MVLLLCILLCIPNKYLYLEIGSLYRYGYFDWYIIDWYVRRMDNRQLRLKRCKCLDYYIPTNALLFYHLKPILHWLFIYSSFFMLHSSFSLFLSLFLSAQTVFSELRFSYITIIGLAVLLTMYPVPIASIDCRCVVLVPKTFPDR